jgi:hypothetical protein
MASHRNQCCSISSSPFPKKSRYQLRDPIVCVPIVELIGITEINPQDPSCDITLELSTLSLLLLIKFVELELLE